MTKNKNYEILRFSLISGQLEYYKNSLLFTISKNIYEFLNYLKIIHERKLFLSINRLIFIST